jgi:hypothetical protein
VASGGKDKVNGTKSTGAKPGSRSSSSESSSSGSSSSGSSSSSSDSDEPNGTAKANKEIPTQKVISPSKKKSSSASGGGTKKEPSASAPLKDSKEDSKQLINQHVPVAKSKTLDTVKKVVVVEAKAVERAAPENQSDSRGKDSKKNASNESRKKERSRSMSMSSISSASDTEKSKSSKQSKSGDVPSIQPDQKKMRSEKAPDKKKSRREASGVEKGSKHTDPSANSSSGRSSKTSRKEALMLQLAAIEQEIAKKKEKKLSNKT